MISAQEAKELTGLSLDEHLDAIEKSIRNAAKNGKRMAMIRSEPYCRWLYDEKNLKPIEKEVVSKLRELGYELKLYYRELQFVDIGLEIHW